MPIVSINLSDGAYAAYRRASKHARRGSAYVTKAVEEKAYRQMKGHLRAETLMPGDMRRTSSGYLLQYQLQVDGDFKFIIIEHPEGQQKLDLLPPIEGDEE
jgi:hypothetical protein